MPGLAPQMQSADALTLRFCGVVLRLSVVDVPDDLSLADPIFCNVDIARIQCAIAVDFADDTKLGMQVPPLIRNMLDFAAKIADAMQPVALLWKPQNILSGRDYFCEAVERYVDGGPFPSLLLVQFRGGEGTITTAGLELLVGQEIEFELDDKSSSEGIHRLVRLVHDMMINGPIGTAMDVPGIDAGEYLRLTPSADGAHLHVRKIFVS